jgi:RNA-binding protein
VLRANRAKRLECAELAPAFWVAEGLCTFESAGKPGKPAHSKRCAGEDAPSDSVIVLALVGDQVKFRRMVTIALSNAQIRTFKAQAQRLKATLKIGREGISPRFLAALDDALKHHELIKVKFEDFKEQKKELSLQLAERSGSHLVTRVGNVVVLYRPIPGREQPKNPKETAQDEN